VTVERIIGKLSKKSHQTYVDKRNKKGAKALSHHMKTALYRIVFTRMYPRLDVNVSKQMHHLLKAPFCIHPKTGRVCIPIDPTTCDNFNPFHAPTLETLHNELNDRSKPTEESGRKLKAWERTSMRPHIEYFARFVKTLPSGRTKISKADTTDW